MGRRAKNKLHIGIKAFYWMMPQEIEIIIKKRILTRSNKFIDVTISLNTTSYSTNQIKTFVNTTSYSTNQIKTFVAKN